MEKLPPSPAGRHDPILIIFSGLPGTGKTSIARELARRLSAVYLRIDSMEHAIRDSAGAGPEVPELYDQGYRVAYAVAEDNLRLGQTVISDSVNPIRLTRDAWIEVAERVPARALEVEVICSDPVIHRERVESRRTDIPGLRLPAWQDVLARRYEPWRRTHVVIDSAHQNVTQSVEALQAALASSSA